MKHITIAAQQNQKSVVCITKVRLNYSIMQQVVEEIDHALQAHPNIRLDWSSVEFIDSTSIGILVSRKKQWDIFHYQITLRKMNDNILSLFKMLWLDKYFEIEISDPKVELPRCE